MAVDVAAQRADEHLWGPPCEETLLLTPGSEFAECIFERQIRRLTDLLRSHQSRLQHPLSELQKQKEVRCALEIERALAAYRKLRLFERFLWSSALCEYLAATVGPVLNTTSASKHAAVLHLRLFRRQAHIRGDSVGAAAIQTVQFWTRPGRGLLAASLSRWMALLHSRRAKRHLVMLAETHFREALSIRAFTAWRPCDGLQASPNSEDAGGSPAAKRKLVVDVSSCDGTDVVVSHQHRGVSVASARMRQQADGCRSPDKRLSAYVVSPPSLTQPPWSPSGPSKSPSCAHTHMPNLELLRKVVAERRKRSVLPKCAALDQSSHQAHQSWISASSTFRDSKQLSPMSSIRGCQSVQ